MNKTFGLEVGFLPNQWTGSGYAGDKHRTSKKEKLGDLLNSLVSGEIDIARQSFTALINVAPEVAMNPLIVKLGSALQSSNMPWAQSIGREINAKSIYLLPEAHKVHETSGSSETVKLSNNINSESGIDLRA
tara:strand:+ start:47 stop:442 length:396 start_codon:yes stop_codon:yes gene_type:complete